jgi:hypothetical protein
MMFVKATWMMAIAAALCVAHTHASQAAKPADAIGTSTIIRDASGKEIGSAANYYDKNGTLIGSETTYFSNAPATAPTATPAAAAVTAKPANATPKPAYHTATSTIIRDANGKEIGSSANYFDKDGNLVDTKTTYHSNAPAATPAAAAVAAKSADASKTTNHMKAPAKNTRCHW